MVEVATLYSNVGEDSVETIVLCKLKVKHDYCGVEVRGKGANLLCRHLIRGTGDQ